MLDAVILDLGNVLAFHDNELLFLQLGEAYGREPTQLQAELDQGLWDAVNTGHLPGDALRRELNARLGRTVDRADFEARWSCHFTINTPMVKAVEALVGKTTLVLLSNTHDLHMTYLRPRLPVLERFGGLVLSCGIGLRKPDLDIFRYAAQVAGAAPSRCVFFDDIERYAKSATAAGLHGRVFTSVDRFHLELRELGLDVR